MPSKKVQPPVQYVKAPIEKGTPVTADSKLGVLVALLKRPEGVDLQTMQAATGWQPHSVRGVISGAIKKKRGYKVTSEKTESGRVWRIKAGGGA